jgi:quercetin 2,3-dioxygenase
MKIRRSKDRGHFNFGWLDTYHTFSFGEYDDPAHVQYGVLRVINEDRVAPSKGFGMHPHDNMEIVTYVIEGVLKHTDSLGHETLVKAGGVQRMTAGSGITHSEVNGSDVPVHILQIWIFPEKDDLPPSHEEKYFTDLQNRLCPIVGKNEPGALKIHQDVKIFASKLKGKLAYDLKPGRMAWLQVIEGPLTCNGETLQSGDGAEIKTSLSLESKNGHFLLFDLAK